MVCACEKHGFVSSFPEARGAGSEETTWPELEIFSSDIRGRVKVWLEKAVRDAKAA